MRRLFLLLMLICLPLQSFAAQIGDAWAIHLSTPAHEIAHIQELQHHHDDDGSVHYDNSQASQEHTSDHSSCAQLTLLGSSALPFRHDFSALADFPEPASWLPSPFLDDPQRPPAFAPGLATGG